jgi:hypothetical protein
MAQNFLTVSKALLCLSGAALFSTATGKLIMTDTTKIIATQQEKEQQMTNLIKEATGVTKSVNDLGNTVKEESYKHIGKIHGK